MKLLPVEHSLAAYNKVSHQKTPIHPTKLKLCLAISLGIDLNSSSTLLILDNIGFEQLAMEENL